MAGRNAPISPLVAVVPVDGGDAVRVHSIDAKEMVATGEYAFADAEPADLPTVGHPKAPVDNLVALFDSVDEKVVQVSAIDAKEILRADDGRYVRQIPAPVLVDPVNSEEPKSYALPEIEQLAAFLSLITDAEQLLEMESRDERVDAKPLYLARFDEIAREQARV